jgi:hypothetical protein
MKKPLGLCRWRPMYIESAGWYEWSRWLGMPPGFWEIIDGRRGRATWR